jgi:hypothetical protein
MTDFLLPSGNSTGSTTSLHTSVRFGGSIHALVEYSTSEELQQQAFTFVQLLNDLYDDDHCSMGTDREKEFLQAWHNYLQVTKGTPHKDLPALQDDPPRLEDLPTEAAQIALCDELDAILQSRFSLHLGRGEHLHLDRKRAHNLLLKLNDKADLERVAAKSVQEFVPARVLEGGCGFLNLPGLNNAN